MANEFVFLVLTGDISGNYSIKYVCSTKEKADSLAENLKKWLHSNEWVKIIQAPVDGKRKPIGDDNANGWRVWKK